MGQLPVSRVTPTSAFHHTGAYFTGPLMVKRGYSLVNIWFDPQKIATKGFLLVFSTI